jgi:large subunit ribosomal protein L13
MKREIRTIEAQGKIVGRLASEIAFLLRGKNLVTFDPSRDEGAIVEVKNVQGLVFTGKKAEQKVYHHYSGYPGGLKTKSAKELKVQKPEMILRAAVSCMLPKNSFRKAMLKRLKFIK